MRWKRRTNTSPADGDIRVVSRFLIFPKCIENEFRWLERIEIIQRYNGIELVGNNVVGGYWVDHKWASERKIRGKR